MRNFNDLEDGVKQLYHEKLIECSTKFGGVNFFLQMVEALRKNKPHPLIASNCDFRFPLGYIRWNKVLFQDKVTLIIKLRSKDCYNENVLPTKGDKNYKNIYNLICTLKPIIFSIKRKNLSDGEGFECTVFDIIDDKTTKLNPVFDVLFFWHIDMIRKAFNYKSSVED
jgi:hypothetical protein